MGRWHEFWLASLNLLSLPLQYDISNEWEKCPSIAAKVCGRLLPLPKRMDGRWMQNSRLRRSAALSASSRPSLYFLLDSFPSNRKAMDLSVEEIAATRERCGGRVPEMAELLRVSEAALRRRMKQLGLRPWVASRSPIGSLLSRLTAVRDADR